MSAIEAASPSSVIGKFLASGGAKAVSRLAEGAEDAGGLYCYGAGKAASGMLRALTACGLEFAGGQINCLENGHAGNITLKKCSHPLTGASSVRNTEAMIEEIQDLPESSAILFLLSGGASAMLSKPIEPITVAEKRKITKKLLMSAACIGEINCVRRHLSEVKGGKLAKLCFPRRVHSLLMSDVTGNRLEDIGSGPMCGDPTTVNDALAIMRKYHATDVLPRKKTDELASGRWETVRTGDRALSAVRNTIIADNSTAISGIVSFAERSGVSTRVDSRRITSTAEDEVPRFIARARRALKGNGIFISGGEALVDVRSEGYGGRCQHFALMAGMLLREGEYVAALATDGRDGNTGNAGAVASVIDRREGSEFLDRYDSAKFFEKTGTYIRTGDTGTNVSDVYLYLRLDCRAPRS
jgi:glycerate 2-kinase